MQCTILVFKTGTQQLHPNNTQFYKLRALEFQSNSRPTI